VGWAARSALHHAGRRAGAALGSRSQRLPAALQGRLSLEGRPNRARDPVPRGRIDEPTVAAPPFDEVLLLSREGAAPLEPSPPGIAERRRLRLAVIVPPFLVGSGGHGTVFKLVKRLEEMGHTCSIWLYDPEQQVFDAASVLRRRIVDHFAPVRAPMFKGFDDWFGADVVVATGWETVYPAVVLPGCRARVYLINDHEPDFFNASAQRRWAEATYRLGLYGISASRWLRDLLEERYGQAGTWFRLGVERETYQPRPVERRRDTVIFYARGFTGRRALPLGLLALTDLHRRRPDTRFVLFGQMEPVRAPFRYETLGVTTPEVLAWNYSEATAGLCLSLTNYSLIPQEMMACGLPCVDLLGGSSEAELGRDGPLLLAEPDPVAIADALERLLGDAGEWSRRSEAGLAFVETASWDLAARQVEAGLREALRRVRG
jgi:glycosyltransferase involved in cell wall biosynthesis